MANADHGHAAAGHAPDHPIVGHLMPWQVLTGTFIALLILTWLTVLAVQYDLGVLNLWIAMGIATVKAALVCIYFMHLRYDRPFNAIVLVGSLLFVFLFVALAMTDVAAYYDEVIWQQVELKPRG